MRAALAAKSLVAAVVVFWGATWLTRYWYDHPDEFPGALRWAAQGFISALSLPDADAEAYAELAFLLVASSVLVLLAIWLAWLIARRLMARR